MIPDLPWSPAAVQTALRVIERSEAFVLCEDKGNFHFRYLYTLDGKCVSIGGESLTLQARVKKPAPEDTPPEPEPSVRAEAGRQAGKTRSDVPFLRSP